VSRRTAPWTLAATLALGHSLLLSAQAEGPGRSVRARVDLTVDKGMGVELEVEGLGGDGFFLKRGAPEEEIAIRDVVVTTRDGRPLDTSWEGGKLRVQGAPADGVIARYQAEPGGLGRHGHQGWVDEDWASFDGRVFLSPRGAQDVADIQVTYDTPEGWAQAVPFEPVGDGWRVPFAPGVAWKALTTTCVGMGRFEMEVVTLGQTPVRIWAYAGFDEAHRRTLFDGTKATAKYFGDTLAFDQGFPFHIVWTPKPADGRNVFGGAWANGACYEHPEPRRRNWELLGHRFAHPMNKYLPNGPLLMKGRDHWFVEGWASYIEFKAAAAAGHLADEGRWNDMYRDHLSAMRNHPDWHVALATEPEHGHELMEYLHYTKGPLVVKMLEWHLATHTGKDLADYMVHHFQQGRGAQGAIDLRSDLEAWAGVDLDPFWSAYVDAPGEVIPVWPEYLAMESVAQVPSSDVIGRVGELPVTAAYLHYLLRGGEFEGVDDAQDFLQATAAQQARLRAAKVPWLPEPVLDKLYAVLPPARLSIDRAALAQPTPEVPAPSGGCMGSQAVAPEPSVAWSPTAHPEAEVFEQLLADEEAYHRAMGAGGVAHVDLKHGTHAERGDTMYAPSLSFDEGDKVVFYVQWHNAPAEARIDVYAGDKRVARRTMHIEPTWSRTWIHLDPAAFGDAKGLLSFRVITDEGELIRRSYWRR